MSKLKEQTFFIGNLHFDAVEETLTEVFRASGYKVGTTKVARDKADNRSMGFGFVTLLITDEDELVADMYGTEVMGRPIRVAVSTSSRPQREA